ncbi:MAG: hypothetical protein CMF63_02390 [Magnetovibrio sp.]|jgi:transposase|nr:hypothetical protein [Magnetovibrio sp.]
MAKPLSLDLRERIVEAVDADGGIRTVAARFGVSPRAVSKIHKQRRETGSVAPAKMGDDRRRISVSRKICGRQLCLLFTLIPPPRTSAALVF